MLRSSRHGVRRVIGGRVVSRGLDRGSRPTRPSPRGATASARRPRSVLRDGPLAAHVLGRGDGRPEAGQADPPVGDERPPAGLHLKQRRHRQTVCLVRPQGAGAGREVRPRGRRGVPPAEPADRHRPGMPAVPEVRRAGPLPPARHHAARHLLRLAQRRAPRLHQFQRPEAHRGPARASLAKWETLARRSGCCPPTRGNKLADIKRPERYYPEDGLVLYVTSRDLPRDATRRRRARRGGLAGDGLEPGLRVVHQGRGQAIPARRSRRWGRSTTCPFRVVHRIACAHLVDNVRGQTSPFEDSQVKKARLTTEVTAVDGDVVSLRLEGETRTADEGQRSTASTMRLLGKGDLRPGQGALPDVRAGGRRLARAARRTTAAGATLDEAPIGILFTLAGDEPVRADVPAFNQHRVYRPVVSGRNALRFESPAGDPPRWRGFVSCGRVSGFGHGGFRVTSRLCRPCRPNPSPERHHAPECADDDAKWVPTAEDWCDEATHVSRDGPGRCDRFPLVRGPARERWDDAAEVLERATAAKQVDAAVLHVVQKRRVVHAPLRQGGLGRRDVLARLHFQADQRDGRHDPVRSGEVSAR